MVFNRTRRELGIRSAFLGLFVASAFGCNAILGLDAFTDGAPGSGGSTSAVSSATGSVASSAGPGGSTSSTTSSASASSAGGGGGGPSDVTGHQNIRYYGEGGPDQIVEPDLSMVPIGALAGAMFNAYPGKGAFNGSFDIPAVPAGLFYLQVGTPQYPQTYFYTGSRNIDLTYPIPGRSTSVAPTMPTPLGFTFTGFNPWAAGDKLLFWADATGTYGDLTPNISPTVGATQLSATIDTETGLVNPALISTDNNDRVYFIQMSPKMTAGGNAYSVVTSVASPVNGLNQMNGQSATVTGAATSVPLNLQVPLGWKISQFDALAPSINPLAVPYAQIPPSWVVEVSPGGANDTFYGTGAQVLLSFGPASSMDVNDTFDYGVPFDFSSLLATSYINHDYSVAVTVPGATKANSIICSLVRMETVAQLLGAGPIVPGITPVQNATIDGKPFYTAATLSTTTPVLKFDAPAKGTATSYEIAIENVYLSGTDTARSRTGTVITDQTSVAIPAGMLASKQYYAFRISAIHAEGVDFNATPAASSFPYYLADTVTALMQTP